MSVKRCPRCGFVGVFRVLALGSGTMHEADPSKRDVCPNDGVDLDNVSREELDAWARESVVRCEAETAHAIVPPAVRCICGAKRWPRCIACDGDGMIRIFSGTWGVSGPLRSSWEPCYWCDGRGAVRP